MSFINFCKNISTKMLSTLVISIGLVLLNSTNLDAQNIDNKINLQINHLTIASNINKPKNNSSKIKTKSNNKNNNDLKALETSSQNIEAKHTSELQYNSVIKTKLLPPNQTIAITGGLSHSLLLQSNGSVWSFGSNAYGQLGNNQGGDADAEVVDIAVHVDGLKNISSIDSGWVYSLALTSDGFVYAWGDNTYGQIADTKGAPGIYSTSPVLITELSDIISISSGASHSLALQNSGVVYAWGQNQYGQLGKKPLSQTEIQTYPVVVKAIDFVTAISAGGNHSLALIGDGSVWSWGDNTYGQLGYGSYKSGFTPKKSPFLKEIIAIDAGENFSMALKQDGSVLVWGENSYWQLGKYGSNSSTPIELNLKTSKKIYAKKISAGNSHALLLDSDGAVWSWGRNNFGQSACGTANKNCKLQIIKDIPKSLSIFATSDGSFLKDQTGSIWAWGKNNDAQLGEPSLKNLFKPTNIKMFSETTN